MKVLLISSNPKAKVPNTGFDMYVHFNDAKHWGKTPKDKSIIAVRRMLVAEKAGTFSYLPIHKEAKEVWAIGWKDDVKSIDAEIKYIDLAIVPYKEGKSPTSGMAATYHFLDQGDEVYWCGFDLTKSPRFNGGGVHDWLHEREMQLQLIADGIVKEI